MHLGQIAARRADLFPDVRRRVQADDVHAVVAEVEHVSRHVVENDRIRIVEIPLIGPECGHDNLVHFRAPGEVAGRGLREDLRNGLLELVRNGPVIVEEETILVLLLSCLRAHCPLMILTGVVHDEVETYAHSAGVAVVRQLSQVFHSTQFGLNLAEVRDSVAAVAAVLGALQQRHQVQVVDAALLDVIQMLLNALQIAGEAVGVHEHTEHIVALVPVGRCLAGLVPLFQKRASLLIIVIHHLTEVIKSLLIIVIELAVQPLHFIIMSGQPLLKYRIPVLVFKHTFPPVGVLVVHCVLIQYFADPADSRTHAKNACLFGLFVECNRFHYN